ncbi:MAG: hypothetical protein RL689_884 [Planctomycetota bacterium]|jgi:phosphoglycolate phosphatase-like HAD superfamily hydrolase
MHRVLWIVIAAWIACTSIGCATRRPDPLPSWNEGPAKRSIIDFVAKVTTPGSPDFVPPAERLAVFDNDGCLWSEQPVYFQLLFAMDRVRAMAADRPQWREEEPFASLLKGDLQGVAAQGEKAIAAIVAATHAGMTTEEFAAVAREWFKTARHPTTGRPYQGMVFQPMLEVLTHLRAKGFRTCIVSGGGVEFIRAYAEETYGVRPEEIIGSTDKLKVEWREGVPVLVKQPAIDFVDDKEGKVIAIQRHFGRRPVMAFGNSDGDLAMLQWTAAGAGPRFCLYVHHDDASREWAYDRASHIGRLDAGLDQAGARGWTVVSMKDDWRLVHPPLR